MTDDDVGKMEINNLGEFKIEETGDLDTTVDTDCDVSALTFNAIARPDAERIDDPIGALSIPSDSSTLSFLQFYLERNLTLTQA